MNQRVLMVSYCFAPQNVIGAVRPTKLAKYLTRMGYEVTVLCGKGLGAVRDPILERDLLELKDVRFVREHSLLRWWKERGLRPEGPRALRERAVLPERALTDEAMRAATETVARETSAKRTDSSKTPAAKSSAKRKNQLIEALYLWLSDRADSAFARACVRTLRSNGMHYDLVISSYGPLSSHLVAHRAKQLGLADRWIADFRDEAAVPFPWQQGRLRRYIRNVRIHADAITSISAGCLRVMGLETFGSVIHNGFDTEDLRGLALPPKRRDRLAFIHCGQMYGSQRDLSPFFRALAELTAEGAVDASRVELIYAGQDTGGFVKQATDAGLGACLHGYGYMPRDESLQLQKSAHVLLLAAWNFQNRQGNLPGKFLEYLMLDMPVICCVSGDLPGSEIADIMKRTNVGFCYEHIHDARDRYLLKEYIRTLYSAFTRGEPAPFAPDPQAVAQFGYAGVARAFAAIIENV